MSNYDSTQQLEQLQLNFLPSATISNSMQPSNYSKWRTKKMKEREIVVRGFINKKFGETYGKGLYHRAIFNGTVELRDPYTKYLIDLFEYRRWEASAMSDEQVEWTDRLREVGLHQSHDAVVSWIQHYDPITKTKKAVNGMCVYLPKDQELAISIDDPEHDVVDHWTIDVKACAKPGGNKPVFIATNFDLN